MISPSLANRVACRYLQARDFPSEKALEKYLHDHPQADRHKHHVTKHEDKGHGEESQGGGHGEGHGESEHGGQGHGGTMFSRLKGALKTVAKRFRNAPKDVQKFIADPEHRKASLHEGLKGLKKAGPSYMRQVVKTAKHEVKEFKTAGQGIAAAIKGDKPSAEQKHAMKAVAIHMGLTIAAAVLTTASPGLAAVVAGKSLIKHIAYKAATELAGDYHVLSEVHEVGEGLHHVLEDLLEHIRFAADEKADAEEIFAALVAKHVAEQMKNIDDDTLAKGLGGDEEEDDDEGEQKKQAARVASRYLARA